MSHLEQLDTLARDRRFVSIAWRFTKNTEDAEDIVQDALLSAWKHIGDFHGEAKLSTWFGSIVINTALMKVRGKKREHVELSDRMISPERSPESRAMAADALSKTLVKMRDSLQPSQRAVISMYADGMMAKEVAQHTGFSVAMIKTVIARGRARLRANA